MSERPCSCCAAVASAAAGSHPGLIHTFPHSIWVAGKHGFHSGYTMLISRGHTRELHEHPREVRAALHEELMCASATVAAVFQPWKLNHSCYGNQVPHIHWHIFPRYADDPDRLLHPWTHDAEFAAHALDAAATADLVSRLRAALLRES